MKEAAQISRSHWSLRTMGIQEAGGADRWEREIEFIH